MQWRVNTNTFGFDVNVKERPLKLRGILSIIGSVFDSFGFAAPFVLTAKKILQDLCKMKLGWDKEIPLEYNVRWQKWLIDLPMLSKLAIDHFLNQPTLGPLLIASCTIFQTLQRLVLVQYLTCAWLISTIESIAPSFKESHSLHL